MIDLNTQIASLLAALDSARPTAPMRTDHLDALRSDIAAEAESVQLSAEELSLGQPTVERIETGENLDKYLHHLASAYLKEKSVFTRPDWLKYQYGEDHAKTYQDLLTGIEAGGEAADFAAKVESEGGISITAAKTLLTRYGELAAAEQLKKDAQIKISKAIDIRAYLTGALRYLGMTGNAIEELIEEKESTPEG